ncbi:MAG: (Fe-S)-binding protein [Planctomycetota bacterium]|nr:MAG: (Fe-S)-binding protein [Planctomycetota bacterium]
MTLLLAAAWGLFAWQIFRRWRLMTIGPGENRFDQIGTRLRRTWEYAFAQKRMRRYWWAGIAHQLIFTGFVVLLLRTLVLWGRGYSEGFNLWVLGLDQPLGKVYSFLKDLFAVLVIAGTLVFFYYRLVLKPARLSKGFEGILILLIISTMMVADIVYDGASIVRDARAQGGAVAFHGVEPAGSVAAFALGGLSDGAINFLRHAGFWTHSALVLIFLNLLPVSKHFHVVTGIPNVFFQNLSPRGRLPNVPDIEGKLEREETLGLKRIEQLSWKAVLDLYTCTECGRCTDQCPANSTGKLLSPKQLTLDLRDYLYKHEKALVGAKGTNGQGAEGAAEGGMAAVSGNGELPELVPDIIKPEVLWACTTCGACETECPVFITYVDKIVDMRRNLVMEKSEFPAELQNAFRGMETNSNPWSFPASDRAAWTEGLDVPRMAEKPDADVLFWVGCSASFDDRARRIARAMAQLLTAAGVNYAILGEEECCTGDPARRAGNEFLFQMMAQTNAEILNNYKPRTIVASCPHCFNTLANEYPDFGARFRVVHHTEFLAQLVAEGKLKPKNRIDAKVAYHDSCYLGRYNEIYEPPRDTLRAIPGLTVLEPTATRDRGMCCGAGGAQMFKEEEHAREGAKGERVNEKRTDQLLETMPDMVASSCPFCQRMLIDGLAGRGREDVKQFDVAELLWQAVGEA